MVAFPEVFVPGYPYWSWITDPIAGSPWFERLARASILIDGPEVAALQSAARDHAVHVVIGVNERSPISWSALYNTMLFIGPDGALLGRHRKLVPTWAEKLTWSGGDGSSLVVYPTAIGPLGGLACGENTNTLARFALLAQGELVHVASYIALPVAPPDYDMAEAIRLRAAAHSFEGKLFTVAYGTVGVWDAALPPLCLRGRWSEFAVPVDTGGRARPLDRICHCLLVASSRASRNLCAMARHIRTPAPSVPTAHVRWAVARAGRYR